jgi:cytochrome c5
VKIFKVLFLLAGSLASTLSFAIQESDNKEIAERIKPVGSVHIAGAQPQAAASGVRSGMDIYGSACIACHAAGVLGAPKLQNAADWGPRLEKGFDAVWENALNGLNAMPPMGACGDCSKDDIKAAIEYMIEGV